MNISITSKLEEQETGIIDKMKSLDPKSEEYAKVMKALESTHKMLLDAEKVQNESDFHGDEMVKQSKELTLRQQELDLKERTLDETASDHRWSKILGALTTGVSIGTTCYWASRGFKFEESGCWTSKTLGMFMKDLFKIPKIF